MEVCSVAHNENGHQESILLMFVCRVLEGAFIAHQLYHFASIQIRKYREISVLWIVHPPHDLIASRLNPVHLSGNI